MPTPVATLLYGSLGPVYIAEAVSACRETGQSIPLIVDMLAQVKISGTFIYRCKPLFVDMLAQVKIYFIHSCILQPMFEICMFGYFSKLNIFRCLSAARASQCQCWRR